MGILAGNSVGDSWPSQESCPLIAAQNGTLRKNPPAFTLIELLTVIAVVGILAALLLPVLHRVKLAAGATDCRNHMRQLGLALSLYVSDFDKYPLDAQSTDLVYSWRDLLFPYCGGEARVFFCPKILEVMRSAAIPVSLAAASDGGYHYNSWGTARMDSYDSKGLGLGGVNREIPVPEALVLAPSDMIALGEGSEYVFIPGFGWPGYPAIPIDLHGGRTAAVFCDAHVEVGNPNLVPRTRKDYGWTSTWTDEAHAKRWNRDNQPHPETWPQP